MLWILAALTLVAGIVALMVVSVKRPADVGELGAVSDGWIAEHRADVPEPSRRIPKTEWT
jgi:hypothetical protein